MQHIKKASQFAARRLAKNTLLIALVTACLALLQATTSTAAPIENPRLYQIKKGESVSWILGTIHVGVPYSDLKHAVQPKLESARLVFAELSDKRRTALWLSNPVEAILTSINSGLNLGNALAPHLKRYVRDELKIPAAIAARMTTRACGAIVEGLVYRQPRLDHEILAEAWRMSKIVRALDSDKLRGEADKADADVAGGAACEVTEAKLRRSNHKEIQTSFNLELADYRTGLASTDPNFPYDSIGLTIRNKDWVETIRNDLERGSVFVFVGDDHLYGRGGLITLLREQGFEMTQVKK